MAGKKGRSGPPKGSMNGIKTGTSLCRLRLVIGSLPSRFRVAQKQARDYRRKIIEGVGVEYLDSLALHQVDLGAQCTAEESILRQLLRDNHEKLNPGQIQSLLKQIRDSKQVRIEALRNLRDSVMPRDPWEIVDEEGSVHEG